VNDRVGVFEQRRAASKDTMSSTTDDGRPRWPGRRDRRGARRQPHPSYRSTVETARRATSSMLTDLPGAQGISDASATGSRPPWWRRPRRVRRGSAGARVARRRQERRVVDARPTNSSASARHGERPSRGQAPTAWTPPSTWTISPWSWEQSESSATQARATGSESLTSHPSGPDRPRCPRTP